MLDEYWQNGDINSKFNFVRYMQVPELNKWKPLILILYFFKDNGIIPGHVRLGYSTYYTLSTSIETTDLVEETIGRKEIKCKYLHKSSKNILEIFSLSMR